MVSVGSSSTLPRAASVTSSCKQPFLSSASALTSARPAAPAKAAGRSYPRPWPRRRPGTLRTRTPLLHVVRLGLLPEPPPRLAALADAGVSPACRGLQGLGSKKTKLVGPLRRGTRASAAGPWPPYPPPPPPCCRPPGLRPGSGGRRRPPFLVWLGAPKWRFDSLPVPWRADVLETGDIN